MILNVSCEEAFENYFGFSELTEILSAIFPLAVIGKMNCKKTLISDLEVYNVV